MLGDGEETPGDGELVIGGEGDQAQHPAARGLDGGQAIQAQPGAWCMGEVWRKRGVFAVTGLGAWCGRSRWIGWIGCWHGAALNAGREPPRGGQTSATPWHDCRSGR